MGLKVWSSWGPGGRKPKSPYYGGFFFYHAKSRHRSSVFFAGGMGWGGMGWDGR